MKASFRRFALMATASATSAGLLCACATSSDFGTPDVRQAASTTSKRTFSYTGAEQSFKVPSGVTQLIVTASGASGGAGYGYGYNGYSAPGGLGGRVKATIAVTPGEKLAIFVGGSGSDGGFNGGGGARDCGSDGTQYCGVGGGASDVRQGGSKVSNRILVAGGGGGGGSAGLCIYTSCGYSEGGIGGSGGGYRGADGGSGRGSYEGNGGTGGTRRAGGSGGTSGAGGCPAGLKGTRGQGGAGGAGGSACGSPGGGGGGGYYGGGGGGAGGQSGTSISVYASSGGGGGGGSAFVEGSATHVRIKAGVHSGDGVVEIQW